MATQPFPPGADRFLARYDPHDPLRIVQWSHMQSALVRPASVAPADPDLDYMAVACLGVDSCCEPPGKGSSCVESEIAQIGGTDRFGVWLGEARPDGNDVGAAPPVIRFQIRAAWGWKGAGALSEVVFEKNLILANWQDHGLVVQVDDVMARQWEFWAFINATDFPAARPVRLGLTLVTGRGAGFPSVRQGHLVP